MMQQRTASNSHVKSFLEEPELVKVDLQVPDIAAVVDESHFTHKVIDLEKLHNLALQVEVVIVRLLLPVFLFSHDRPRRDVTEVVQVLGGEHALLFEAFTAPLPERFDCFVVLFLHLEALAEEESRDELLLRREASRGEHGPTAVVAHVQAELDVTLVCVHKSAVDANDLSAALNDRQVVELLGEADQSNELDNAVGVEFARRVRELEGDNPVVLLETLVGVSCVDDNREQVHVLGSHLELVQRGVLVTALACCDGLCFLLLLFGLHSFNY